MAQDRVPADSKYSGSMKITTHLDHNSHCQTASGTNWSNIWTYRVFIMNTRRRMVCRRMVGVVPQVSHIGEMGLQKAGCGQPPDACLVQVTTIDLRPSGRGVAAGWFLPPGYAPFSFAAYAEVLITCSCRQICRQMAGVMCGLILSRDAPRAVDL